MKEREKNTKTNLLYRQFRQAIIDLKKIHHYFWISCFLFFFIAFLGALLPPIFEQQIKELIIQLLEKTKNLNTIELIQFIIANNITSAFFGMMLGILLAVPPVIVIMTNGYLLGYVAKKSIEVESIFILWRLLPHGIFEIPAILISVALGIRLGFLCMYNCIITYNKKIKSTPLYLLMVLSVLFLPLALIVYCYYTFKDKKLKTQFYNNLIISLRIFFLIVIPLLVIAGIIEGLLIGLVN